jgi:hypothetical protein
MRNILRATIPIACALVAMPAIAQVPVLDSTPIAGCPAETLAFHACAQDKAKNFSPPRTTDGRPDLQGFWRGRLTMDRSVEGIDGTEPMTRSPFNPWSVFPSLIIDTPDRKIPYQPWAAEVGRKGRNFQEYIDPRTACGPGSLSRLFRDLVQILQPPGDAHVALLFEDHRVSRLIPTDGRPHVRAHITLASGDSVGRWEGNSLVIDVTNLNGYTWFDANAVALDNNIRRLRLDVSQHVPIHGNPRSHADFEKTVGPAAAQQQTSTATGGG